MLDVLFVIPFTFDPLRDPPVGTLLLATILKSNGISAELFSLSQQEDYPDLSSFIDATVSDIAKKNAKIISFYTRCDMYHIALLAAEQLKRHTSSTIVFGGPQADIVATQTLQSFPQVDYICRGEGETTVFPFFSSLLQGSADLSVAGLVYRNNADIVENPRPALLQNLDLLPEIDYSIMGLEGDYPNVDHFLIDVGRGCPFSCTYCSTNTFWGRKYRLKSPDRIIQEVKSLYDKYKISSFSFSHDMFTLDRNQVTTLCQKLKELPFQITWGCSARVDCIDKELIDVMSDAGMTGIYLGIETGSERMQKLIHKNLKLHSIIDLLQHLHSKGIRITTSFIHGFPEETPADLSETLALIAEIAKFDKVRVQNHLCAFLPSTELSVRYAKELVPSTFFSDQTGFSGIAGCEELISSHPEVFPQYMEYHTELREKLEYFPLFVRVWLAVQPIYQYLSSKYKKEQLIDMYFDFVNQNQNHLEKVIQLPYLDQLSAFLENDQFPQYLAPKDLQPIIKEGYRMASLLRSSSLLENGPITEVFSFSPKEFQPGSDITAYKKRLTVVQYKKLANNQIEISIKGAS